MIQSLTFTDSHKREMVFLCTELYRTPKSHILTEVWHMAHFWVSYGRCTMPGSPMGRSEGLSRRWTG